MDQRQLQQLISYYSPQAGVSIDSRHLTPGAIFFALRGEHANGAHYIHQALQAGASCAVVDGHDAFGDDRVICVPDVRESLQALASWHRERLRIPVVAITGTNGKTTTKNLLAAALAAKYSVHATSGNYNNDLGLPLTLLGIRSDHEIAVVEMGANHLGEIAQLCAIARPTHGLITSIGEAHLEGFGTVQGVMQAKRELFDYLHSHSGTSFVRTDSPQILAIAQQAHTGCSTSAYSLEQYDAQWEEQTPGRGVLRLSVDGNRYECQTHFTGSYNAINAVAALHVALHFNLTPELALPAIASYRPDNHRSQVVEGRTNRIILDCYNANPSSMREAITSFAAMRSSEPKLMILGGMRELGIESQNLHQRIVHMATCVPDARCLFVGTEWYGLVPEACYLPNAQAANQFIRTHPVVGCMVLLKGSRGIELEQLLSIL